jgi:hypothetical protein
MQRPRPTEYAPYYEKYLSLVREDDVLAAMESQRAGLLALLRGVSEAEGNVRHPPYTWSVKEVVGHLADTERVFGYRALRFARGDTTPLPGFDENAYAREAKFDRVALQDLASEWEALRRSHLLLFHNLGEEAWARSGEANGNAVSVRALAFILVGHTRHHEAILRQRLGKA